MPAMSRDRPAAHDGRWCGILILSPETHARKTPCQRRRKETRHGADRVDGEGWDRPRACASGRAAPRSASRRARRPAGRDRASILFRIGVPQWMPEARYSDLLALFEKYRGVTDEITFFTSATHPPLPLEEIRRRARVLAERMPAGAGSWAIGRGSTCCRRWAITTRTCPTRSPATYTRVTDIDGNVCQGSFCPNDPRVQEYVRAGVPGHGRGRAGLHLDRRRRASGRPHARLS